MVCENACVTFHRQNKRHRRTVYEKTREYALENSIDWRVDEPLVTAILRQPCFLCGTLTLNQQLVRIDTLYGYRPYNVTACCWVCIKLRGDAAPAMLLEYGRKWDANRDLVEAMCEGAAAGAKQDRERMAAAKAFTAKHLAGDD